MESDIEKLSNKLAFKEIKTYELSGKVDSNGLLSQTFNSEQKFNRESSHFIYLVSLEVASIFPNVKKDINDKFYFCLDGIDKIKTINQGGYEIIDYCKALDIDDKKIKFEVSLNTGKCIITIANNSKVDFTKNDTFRNQLGFDAVLLTEGINISQRLCNVQVSQKIYVDCNLCVGSLRNGIPTQIIYSFPNSLKFGYLITEKPRFARKKELLLKNFHEIRMYFYDQDHNAVDFGGELITLEITIEQC